MPIPHRNPFLGRSTNVVVVTPEYIIQKLGHKYARITFLALKDTAHSFTTVHRFDELVAAFENGNMLFSNFKTAADNGLEKYLFKWSQKKEDIKAVVLNSIGEESVVKRVSPN